MAAALPPAAVSPEIEAPAGRACAPLAPQLVDSLFQHWAELVQAGDPEAVADLYAGDALLLPTLSASPRHTHGAIADYFSGFAARHPQAEVVEHTVYPACNQLVDAGLYRFRFPAPGSGQDTVVQARYTLVYGFNGQQWQLLHHHSSLLPDSAPVLPVDP
jgi:uncharacterized protein (TIGR02246 family)